MVVGQKQCGNKDKYRILCTEEPSIPIFSKDWWLDTTAGEDWDVVLVEKGGKYVASLPFVVRNRFGMTALTSPPLTQTLGPWVSLSATNYTKKLAQEKDLIQELYNKLPPHIEYNQNWHYQRTNWLPLYWLDYDQTTRYTFRIGELSDLDQVWNDFQGNIRREIRKAKNKEGIIIRTDLSIDDFLELNKKVFIRQDMTSPYSWDLVKDIYHAANKNNAGKIFIAVDNEGRHHAGALIIWDENSAYYLLGGGDPELRNSGATSLCMWEAIQFTATVTKSFDFEGSMIEPIERFFRAFGARQTPYFNISKTSSRLLKGYRLLQRL